MTTTRKYTVTYRKKIRETGDKKYIFPQIGMAYEKDDGYIDVIINAIPLNWDGKIRLWLREDSVVDNDIETDEIDED